MMLPPPFNRQTRERRLEAASGTAYDVIVVGGGITGAGIARDAAMRGLKVALVEKEDLAAGTSSRSSKLVHGGLRYLEHYEFGLVFESVAERALLRRLAPHLVQPLPFVFPGFRGDRVPLMMMAAGVTLYDMLSLGRAYRFHRRYSRRGTQQLEPALRTDGLKGSLLYYDCATDDGRLTLATALSAHDHGAHLFPRLRVDELLATRGSVEGVDCTDQLTGERRRLRGHVVIAAMGPWTDSFVGQWVAGASRILRPTKGIHIVVDHARLPVRHAVVMSGPDDHRILFAIPWGNRTYVGTTDTDFDGNLDQLHATAADVDYLLKVANRDFPASNLTTDDVIATWTGLRPLVADEGSGSESSVSREHELKVFDNGLVVIAGGKLTTYRRMAAEVLEATRQRLKTKGVQLERCTTGRHPLVGGGVPAAPTARLTTAVGAGTCQHLVERYGSDWDAVAGLVNRDAELGERLVDDLPTIRAEIAHALNEEGALTLEDLLIRRTDLFFKARDQGLECIDAVADLAASHLGWDADQRQREVEQYRDVVALSRRYRDGRG